MPKILIFVPCDKVIVSEQDNTTSIVSIIEAFNIAIPEGIDLPEVASIPLTWHVLSFWERLAGEENRHFEQLVELSLPDGKVAFGGSMTLDFKPESKRFRAVSSIIGFPVSSAGVYLLKLSVREIGQDNAWQPIADYNIYISRASGKDTPPTAQLLPIQIHEPPQPETT